ncbi:MAG: hypothetical protein F6K31_23960 [Symploca sp. SIO2G7]|nr:hypothetical protein [Symploca sp. SIO2G7]
MSEKKGGELRELGELGELGKKRELIIFGYKAQEIPPKISFTRAGGRRETIPNSQFPIPNSKFLILNS